MRFDCSENIASPAPIPDFYLLTHPLFDPRGLCRNSLINTSQSIQTARYCFTHCITGDLFRRLANALASAAAAARSTSVNGLLMYFGRTRALRVILFLSSSVCALSKNTFVDLHFGAVHSADSADPEE